MTRNKRTHTFIGEPSKGSASAQRGLAPLRKASASRLTVIALVVVISTAINAFTPRCASGAGSEFAMRGEDLDLTIDTRWAGCAHGGYYPIRIRVVNRGAPRNLTFRFEPQESGLPMVERTIGAEQNATVQLTLSIPLVGETSYGELRVYAGGRRLESFTKQMALPDQDGGQFDRPALLVISYDQVNCDRFEDGVSAQYHQDIHGGTRYWGRHGAVSVRSSDHERVEPKLLPDSWLDYTGLDLVAVPLDTFGKLPPPNRAAILHWVHTGGTLIVYNVGEPAEKSQELARLLELNDHSFRSPAWQKADLGQRAVAPRVNIDQFGNMIEHAVEALQQGEVPAGLEQALAGRGHAGELVWTASAETFARRGLMQGTVCAFPENPFPGSASDWNWFLKSQGPRQFQWTARHGVSARHQSDEFLDFLIPGIRGVPVYAFVVLITLFTVVIGPLNYLFLWRLERRSETQAKAGGESRHQLSRIQLPGRSLLVITIPVIAFATSVSLFAYSAVAHGFSIKSRVRSLTMLDQKSKTAVTTSRVALYAGLAPSSGLRFSPETAIYPVWPSAEGFEGGRVDWTEAQALAAGWFRSRTHTQFLTVSHRAERGRLEVERIQGGMMDISNGLEWELESLLVADEKGQLYFGENIPAGAAARLRQATTDDLTAVRDLVRRNPVQRPEGVAVGGGFGLWNDRDWRRMYYGEQLLSTQFAHSLAEQRIGRFSILDSANPLEPKSYMAVLKNNPRVEIGVEKTDQRAGWHMLIGYY